MRVLIVESDHDLATLWQGHLTRQGAVVELAHSQADAVAHIRNADVQVIVLSLDIESGSALAIADFASYRRPDARVIFVTRSRFFSDGSIFQLVPNTAAFVASETPPEDLAALVDYHARPAA